MTQNEVRSTGKSLCFSQNINLYLLFSVIHPDEYEKRIIRFLFDKVFIDSKQTLDELLASPIISNELPQDRTEEQYENSNGYLNQLSESFEFIHRSNSNSNIEVNNDRVNKTTEVLQTLTIQPLTTTDNDNMFTESTSL